MIKLDVLLLILFPIIAVILSLFFRLNAFIATLLFFGVPSLYLSFRTQHLVLKTLIFTLLLIPNVLIWEHLAILDNAWFVPTIFPFRILGTVTLEEMIWYFLLIYLTIILFEHFIDKGKHALIDKHLRNFSVLLTTIFVFFSVLLITRSDLVYISYFYAKSGAIIALPIILVTIFKFPHFIFKLLKVVPYLICLSFLNFVTAMELGHWYYTGNFVGWLDIGKYRLPYEEFIYFILLSSTIFIGYFEFFDDRKDLAKL